MKNYQDKGGRSGGFRGGNGDRKEGFRSTHSFPKKSNGYDRKNDSRSDMRSERGGERETVLFKAICSECKKSCDVPFRPTNDKPVYCRDCFAAKRNRETEIYEASKFGKTPTPAKEIFSQAQPQVKPAHTPSDDGMKRHLMDISSKLDTLILAIEKMSSSKKEAFVETSAQPLLVQTKTTKNILKAITKSTPKKVVAKPVAKVVAKPAAKKAVTKVVAKVANTRSTSTGKTAAKKTK